MCPTMTFKERLMGFCICCVVGRRYQLTLRFCTEYHLRPVFPDQEKRCKSVCCDIHSGKYRQPLWVGTSELTQNCLLVWMQQPMEEDDKGHEATSYHHILLVHGRNTVCGFLTTRRWPSKTSHHTRNSHPVLCLLLVLVDLHPIRKENIQEYVQILLQLMHGRDEIINLK